MPITKSVNSRANAKQLTGSDVPQFPTNLVTNKYTATSTSSQTIINLSFAVDQANKNNFVLIINGKVLSEGASNDFTFTNVQPNNTSSQVTLTAALSAGLNIIALNLGVAQSNYSLATLSASVNQNTAAIPKNFLANGNFDFWQRGTSVTIANTVSTYQADRWYVKNSLGTNGVITFSQVAGVTDGSLFGAKVQITTAPTAAQANGTELYQTIGNSNSIELYNQVASFSARIKALGNVTAVGLQFFYATSEAKVTTALGSEQSVTVNTSTFVPGSILNQSIGTLPTTAGVVGVRIRILTVSSGNTYDLNNGFVVEQAMVNLGQTAATFSRMGRHIEEELAICQRYYEKSFAITTAPSNSGNFYHVTGIAYTTSKVTCQGITFKVWKRATPTIAFFGPGGGGGQWQPALNGSGVGTITSVDVTTFNPSASQNDFYATITATGTPFTVGSGYTVNGEWTADAEI
ncbi:MAG: hypothetical protein OIN85_00740 [Candidatus Methanoperedens sp.]|nr:hypothetical protein [Candidatus Methanoperedens sp.]